MHELMSLKLESVRNDVHCIWIEAILPTLSLYIEELQLNGSSRANTNWNWKLISLANGFSSLKTSMNFALLNRGSLFKWAFVVIWRQRRCIRESRNSILCWWKMCQEPFNIEPFVLMKSNDDKTCARNSMKKSAKLWDGFCFFFFTQKSDWKYIFFFIFLFSSLLDLHSFCLWLKIEEWGNSFLFCIFCMKSECDGGQKERHRSNDTKPRFQYDAAYTVQFTLINCKRYFKVKQFRRYLLYHLVSFHVNANQMVLDTS